MQYVFDASFNPFSIADQFHAIIEIMQYIDLYSDTQIARVEIDFAAGTVVLRELDGHDNVTIKINAIGRINKAQAVSFLQRMPLNFNHTTFPGTQLEAVLTKWSRRVAFDCANKPKVDEQWSLAI